MKDTAKADGFARTYGVELLCAERPAIDKRVLLGSLQRHCPAILPLDDHADSGPLAFIHPDHQVRYADGSVPAQVFVAVADGSLDPGMLEEALQQSWGFPEARARVASGRATVLVSDLMASGLPYRTRLALFQRALAGVLEVVSAQAIRWSRAQQVIDPQAYLAALAEKAAPNLEAGAVNVRFFNLQDTNGEMLMDSLGLAALGLCDVQCHFRDLEPGAVAGLLYGIAGYLFEKGDVIEDGHTVQGLNSGAKWRCQHERSLVPPDRMVLDVDPGPPHAAGGRRSK